MEDLDPMVVTVGDPCGVGPEIVHASIKKTNVLRGRDIYVLGDLELFSRALGSTAELHMYNIVPFDDFIADYHPIVGEFERVTAGRRRPFFVDLGGEIGDTKMGVGSALSGELALGALDAALDLIDVGISKTLVTAPISKHWVHAAGFEFPGHTEALAEHFDADPLMMLIGGGLRVGLATIHVPHVSVSGLLSPELIAAKMRIMYHAIQRDFFTKEPQIAIAGLNPHCGEQGEFGDEEAHIIEPAIKMLHAEGIRVAGPIAPDTIFNRALRGEFHGVLALYHDQGLIPVKLLAMESGVNLTAGLPIVRTSPDHGTAFDIAGVGAADEGAMLCAIEFADAVGRRRAGEFVAPTLCEMASQGHLTRQTTRLRPTEDIKRRLSRSGKIDKSDEDTVTLDAATLAERARNA